MKYTVYSYLLILLLLAQACSNSETSNETQGSSKKFSFIIKTGDSWGVADTSCKFIIDPVYNSIGNFYEGIAHVSRNDSIYFINESGLTLNPKGFLQGTHFSEGLAFALNIDSQFICIDKQMKEVFRLESEVESVETFFFGMAAVKLNGKWGFINNSGKLIIDYSYDAVSSFSEDVAAVANWEVFGDSTRLKWNYIDKSGKKIMDLYFDDALPFHQGLAAVNVSGQWKWIDKKGADLIPNSVFDECRSFTNGFATYKRGERWGIMSISGKIVLQPSYPMIGNLSDRFFSFSLSPEAWGFLDATGKIAVQPIYKCVSNFNDGLAYVVVNTKISLISTSGKIYCKDVYDSAPGYYGSLVGFLDSPLNSMIEKHHIENSGMNQ